MLRRAPNKNPSFQVFGRRGAGKTRGVASPEHLVAVDVDHERVHSIGSSQSHIVTGMWRAKCGCGWRCEGATQQDVQVAVQKHLDGVRTDDINDAIEEFEPELPQLTEREIEDARVRQGTIENLLDGDEVCEHGNEIYLGAFPACCDWWCEDCGLLNRRQEAFCYRCGAGPPEYA